MSAVEGWRLPSGRHAGELITRVPVSYLRWMVNAGHTNAAEARAELGRRGTVLPTIEISNHAIDTASLQVLRRWEHRRSSRREGFYSWLHRLANEALEHAAAAHTPTPNGCRLEHPDGVVFVFTFGEVFPVVKTVLPARRPPTDGKVRTHEAAGVPGERHLGPLADCERCNQGGPDARDT